MSTCHEDDVSIWGLQVFRNQRSPPSFVFCDLSICSFFRSFLNHEVNSLVEIDTESGETLFEGLLTNGWLLKLVKKCVKLEKSIATWTFHLMLYSSKEDLRSAAVNFYLDDESGMLRRKKDLDPDKEGRYQTLNQRDQSFKVNETACLHCGFYSEAGGFTISNKDKTFMQTCKSVVSTCTFGGGDDLYQPIGMSDISLKKVCYVAFWDETTLTTQEAQGHVSNEDGFIGKWRIVIVINLPFRDQILNVKIPMVKKFMVFFT